MAGNKGAILGLGILGISAFAWMSMKQPAATTNGELTPGGVPSYTDESDSGDAGWDNPNCSRAWDSSGNRISNTWVGHGRLDMGIWERGTCDLQGFRIIVYTDKRVYIAGESIKVLILKSYYENDGSTNEWRKWTTHGKEFGEHLSFLLGIESTDGNSLHNLQLTKGTTKSESDIESMQFDGDLKTDGWPWAKENRGIVMKTISTANSDVGEYELTFAGELGPYQSGSWCGSSDCMAHNEDEGCNNRKTTSQKLITILPRDCSSTSSAESYKSESKVDLNAEHFIQSYVNNWM